MAIATNQQKENLALEYGARATHAALFSTVPTGTPGTELTGGSPAYARKANTWNAAAGGALDNANAPVFDVPAGTTVTHVGFWTAATAGTLLAYAAVTNETFGGQGTYTVTDADLDLNG